MRSTSSRNCSIWIQLSAIFSCVIWKFDQRAHPGLARHRPLAHHVERPAGQRDGAHGVMDATAAQPGLGDREGLALAAEHVVGRHPDVGVADVAVRGVSDSRRRPRHCG